MRFRQNNDGRVIRIGHKQDELPKVQVGKVYHSFDDGKIRRSRLIDWEITKQINVDNLFQWLSIPLHYRRIIKDDIKNCYWLYDKNQHFIYQARALKEDGTYDNDIEPCYFLKTYDNTWFGSGAFLLDCLLDVDGSLYQMILEWEREEAINEKV